MCLPALALVALLIRRNDLRTIVIVIALAALVAGCMSREQLLAGDRATCADSGHQVGTDAFAACVQGHDTRRAAGQRRALREADRVRRGPGVGR